MKETIRYGFILGIICFLASAVLSVVNAVTAPKIEEQKMLEERAALEEVMPEADDFLAKSLGDSVYYLAFANQKLIGFVIKSSGEGYSSDIETLAGLDLKLEITNIKILSQNETPGLGNRVEEASFTEQFQGRDSNSIDQVEAITGATISSSAVIDSIKKQTSELENILLQEIKNAG
ncbi:MAG: FMN-binding protein [Candidatus Omnitrophica bacterium]|nr:FMN-binding protein [Candidatus Omnitrophota bacterium]